MKPRFFHQGRFLMELRTRELLTRQEAAKKLGMTQQFYGRIEMGLVGIPKRKYKRVVKVFGEALSLKEVLLWDFNDELYRLI